jgi:hypothetical protein
VIGRGGLDRRAFEAEYLQQPITRPRFHVEVPGDDVRRFGNPPQTIRLPGGELHLGEIRELRGFANGRSRAELVYEWMGIDISSYGSRSVEHTEAPSTREVVQIVRAAWEQEALSGRVRAEHYARELRRDTAMLQELVNAHRAGGPEFEDWIVREAGHPPVHPPPEMRYARAWDMAVDFEPDSGPLLAEVRRQIENLAAAARDETIQTYALPTTPVSTLRMEDLLQALEALRRPSGPREPRTEPEKKARAILLRFLSAEQRETFERRGFFRAKGHETGAEYLVHSARQINIVDFTRRRRLCYVIPEVPLDDQLLAQKMLIEGDEQHLLDVARAWAL